MSSFTLPPVRLCCGQRHYGVICPSGNVMCCLCFGSFSQDQLWVDAEGIRWDVCRECGPRSVVVAPE